MADCDGDVERILDENTGEFRDVPVQEERLVQNQERKSRKRKRQPEKWKRNARQKAHQAGKEYISSRGKTVPAREITTKKDCFQSCKFMCGRSISDVERALIFDKYYSMTQDEKYNFVIQTTERFGKKRKTSLSNKRQNSFYFYLPVNGNMLRVCKSFYLGTLGVSQKLVYGVHKRKDLSTNTPARDGRGKHGKQKRLSDDAKNIVRLHISSFPTVESHYCRSSTKRKYLEAQLSIPKMHELYVGQCKKKGLEALKFWAYSKIFNEEFNLGFHIPKKDRCDLCCEWEISKKDEDLTEELNDKYEKHIKEKYAMRIERNQDRDSGKNVLCFDLQNVITCPKADVGCFFYKSKLNVYNLTGHFSKTGKIYCAIWTELTSGRAGNDLASALSKILEAVLADNPDIKDLVLWSDSCVPQNRNSLISFAVLNFLKEHNDFTSIEIKYCTPGHSAIQEVDSAHSKLEGILSVAEYYSPVSLLRILTKANKQKRFRIIQLQKQDFKDFAASAKTLKYENVPFSTVTHLLFTQHYFIVSYKTSYLQEDWVQGNIFPTLKRSRRISEGRAIQFPRDIPEPKLMKDTKPLPDNKITCIKSMLKFMPLADRDYYKNVLKI